MLEREMNEGIEKWQRWGAMKPGIGEETLRGAICAEAWIQQGNKMRSRKTAGAF